MSDTITRLNSALEARYTIEGELGEGGMAVVYLAEDLRHHRKVALKVLKSELAAVVGAERFLAEIETTAHLQHPHILPLFDSGEADGFLFYVMPYVEGESLRQKLDRERQLPVEEGVRIARDLAEALDYAHRQGVIHRDIKPANILMHEGRPLIADFGIALAVGAAGGTRLTETGLSVGTPYYMSPEQATGDVVVGPPSDTYALGCVLYEMLVGEPPYTGSTAQAVLGRIIQGGRVSATEQRASIPAHVDASIRKALEKLPADRFPSARDFAAALDDPTFRHGEGVGVAAGSAAARWKRLAGVAGTLALCLLAAFAWTLLRPGPPPTVARYGLSFAHGQQPLGMAGLSGQALALAPDGSSIVYVGPGGGTGESGAGGRIWVKPRDRFEATPLAGTEGARSPSVSPDGAWVAFQVGRELRKVPIVGGASVTLADSLNLTAALPVAWLDDGTLVYLDDHWRFRRMPAEGGVADSIWAPADDRFGIMPRGLPGSRGLLLTLCDAYCVSFQEIDVLDLRTGEARPLVPGAIKAEYASTGHLVYVRPDGSVFAAPFDARSLETTGAAVPVLDGVKVDAGAVPQLTLAPDGTLLMMVGASTSLDQEFVWVTREGAATPVDSGWTFDAGNANRGWSLSPDGTRLAARVQTDAGQDIWVKELPRGPLSRLTFYDGPDTKPRWRPDGTQVTFLSDRGGDLDVWTRRADGVGDAKLLFDYERALRQGFWTPDGTWLILRTGDVEDRPGGRDILAIRPGVDSVARPLMHSEFSEQAPAVSPNSRWIAYISDETGRNEVFVRPFPNVDSGKWQVSTDGGTAPLWAHDGRELFYVSPRREVVAVQVEEGQQFRIGERRVLFRLGGEYVVPTTITGMYDITADDQRFLFARLAGSGEEEATRTILVQNWTEEMKAKLAGR